MHVRVYYNIENVKEPHQGEAERHYTKAKQTYFDIVVCTRYMCVCYNIGNVKE